MPASGYRARSGLAKEVEVIPRETSALSRQFSIAPRDTVSYRTRYCLGKLRDGTCLLEMVFATGGQAGARSEPRIRVCAIPVVSQADAALCPRLVSSGRLRLRLRNQESGLLMDVRPTMHPCASIFSIHKSRYRRRLARRDVHYSKPLTIRSSSRVGKRWKVASTRPRPSKMCTRS